MRMWRGSFRRGIVERAREAEPAEPGYSGYQLIRNVLAAYAERLQLLRVAR